MAEQDLPFISVALPVFNEGSTIEGVLDSLLRQDYPPDHFEIIVCDGYSDDDTFKKAGRIAERDTRVRVLRNERRRSSAGRNMGYRNARGDIILYVDGHCVIPDDGLLRAIAELFRKTGAGCLCRAQPLVPDEHGGAWAAAIAAVRASRFGHSQSSYIFSDHEGFINPSSAGAAYKREVFETIGEYDESFDACEDVEFNLRVEKAGFASYISPRLKVLYHARRGLRGLYAQMKRYGKGRFRLLKKHPDQFEWQTLAPPAFVVGVVFVVLALILIPPVRWVIAAATLAAYVAALALTLPGSGQFGRRGWPLYPLVLMTILWGLGVGFLLAAFGDSFTDAVHIGPGRKQLSGDRR